MDWKNKLRVVYGDVTLGLHGENFSYIFSYAQGGMESLVQNGYEWLYRSPKPTFWRALTDNDRGNGFALKSGCWLAADLFIECTDVEVITDGISQGKPCAPANNRYGGDVAADTVKIRFTYQTITRPSAKVVISYAVEGSGDITVNAEYFGCKGLPQLPVFGLRFVMPTLADKYEYQGLSGETYPDRKAGAAYGQWKAEDLMPTPYLVPQDCGMHMDTEWLEITRHTAQHSSRKETSPQKLRIENNGVSFAFSCLPYTAAELENATHQEELPLPRRTVLCLYGKVRGVGGIDSWGSDVEEAYHICGEHDISFSFKIRY